MQSQSVIQSKNRQIALFLSAKSVSQCKGYNNMEELVAQLKRINTRFLSDLDVLYNNNLEGMCIEFNLCGFLPRSDLIDCFKSIASNPIEITRFADLIQDIHPILHSGISEGIAWEIDPAIYDILQSNLDT